MPSTILQQPAGCLPMLHDGEALPESDPGADMDEPPDHKTSGQEEFQRRGILHHPTELKPSLLTKALHDGDELDSSHLEATRKRPSMASNISVASTAELTCDTGNTSPARVLTPSPPHPRMTYVLSHHEKAVEKTPEPAPVRQRRISFACAEPPKINKPLVAPVSSPKPQEKERRPTIKFACAKLPSQLISEPKAEFNPDVPQRRTSIKFACQAKPTQKSVAVPAGATPVTEQQPSRSTSMPIGSTFESHGAPVVGGRASKYIAATDDLRFEGSRFHEFASDETQPDDWIIQDSSIPKQRLTMSDILQKELALRKLAREALEEDETQDEEDQDNDGDDEDDDCDGENDDDDEDIDDENDVDDYEEIEDDGYNTDTEHGFADSDEENEDGEIEVDVPVWFPKQNPNATASAGLEVYRPATSLESNCSVFSASNVQIIPTHRMKIPCGKPDLPDSTDFVCGTFDEDRVVEDMYLTVVAARKRSKLLAIPQDIDPSFPTSEPEDEEDNDDVSNAGDYDSEEHVLGFGELEDIHHGQERVERRRRRSDACSPRTRYRSPPPKKQISPPYKPRGRSPRPLFGRTSPKRLQSPALSHFPRSPRASPVHKTCGGAAGCRPLASRPGLTATKSLPRPAGLFPGHFKARRKSAHASKGAHTRGAIDIVKGLEEKRQRRREKYLQKYCDRARKGQIPEKKPVPPGRGAERMREVGLYMAGKLGPGYVLSI